MQLTIVILNHNTKGFLNQTLRSINTSVSHEIIVVDNASTDGSQQLVRTQHKSVILIESPKNIGFAAGNNLGLKRAQGKNILLLNSDTKVLKNSLDVLITYLNANQKVGIVTPKLLLPDDSIDLASHRGFPTITNSLAYFLKLEQIFPNSKTFSAYHQTYKNFDTIHQVDAVSGAAMMFKSILLKKIGYLDERFFMYAEDIDFCLRAKKAGWQVIYNPQATVIHFKGASGTKSLDLPTRKKTNHQFFHTMKQYYDKHHASNHPKTVKNLVHLAVDIIKKAKS